MKQLIKMNSSNKMSLFSVLSQIDKVKISQNVHQRVQQTKAKMNSFPHTNNSPTILSCHAIVMFIYSYEVSK